MSIGLVSRLTARVKRDYFRRKYEHVMRMVGATRPLERGNVPFMLLSMVQQRDVQSYILAVKSFARFANPERIVIICDPSINERDRSVFRQHVPHVELRRAEEFTHPALPRGGTWERLFAISEFVSDHYVVQLDADTLTVQPVPEVLHAIGNGCGFVLGEKSDTCLLALTETSRNALPFLGVGSHVQDRSEAAMADLGLPEDACYVRGCSGFTGFPRSDKMRQTLVDFSGRMADRLGADWKRWGTEQVTSNYLVANAWNTVVLPFPKYGTPDSATADTAFFHFIGSMRFINNKYEAMSRRAIRLIGNAAA